MTKKPKNERTEATSSSKPVSSGIRDNYLRGTAADFLRAILEILRLLCAEKTVPYEELCNLFDCETKNGSDMRAYSDLLQKAVDSIVATFRRRVAAGLQNSRDFVIPDRSEQAKDNSDFELVTWVVIK